VLKLVKRSPQIRVCVQISFWLTFESYTLIHLHSRTNLSDITTFPVAPEFHIHEEVGVSTQSVYNMPTDVIIVHYFVYQVDGFPIRLYTVRVRWNRHNIIIRIISSENGLIRRISDDDCTAVCISLWRVRYTSRDTSVIDEIIIL